ncbi:MAG: hypothetical protein H6719_15515 [Sandaracinaceae bacterium]|nr:hypothetical protein [Sandaracinaceae bacterium]
MQTVPRKSRRGQRSPGRPIPPVLDPDELPPSVGEEPSPGPVEPPRPLERRPDGREIDWGRNSTLEKGSANRVLLWFLVPLVLLVLWQVFFDHGVR